VPRANPEGASNFDGKHFAAHVSSNIRRLNDPLSGNTLSLLLGKLPPWPGWKRPPA
jgi:hypothetical protein